MLLLSLALTLTLLGSSWGCGVPAIRSAMKFHRKIVRVGTAVPGSWPWQVSLQNNNGFHSCGGSLISPSWVVTAAHCNIVPGYHVVVLGENNRLSNSEPLEVMSISQVITHPHWDPTITNNDLTLLKLASPVKYTERISPVCLPSPNEVLPSDSTCVTTGWGRISGTSYKIPANLQEIALPLVTERECQNFWRSLITNSMICAGGSGATMCKGESGGPLVCQKGDTWVLTGIVSWGTKRCNVHSPDVYTRVSKFSTWINQVIAQK